MSYAGIQCTCHLWAQYYQHLRSLAHGTYPCGSYIGDHDYNVRRSSESHQSCTCTPRYFEPPSRFEYNPENEGEIECDNVKDATSVDEDITKELRRFFLETEQHRRDMKKEHDKKSKIELEKLKYKENDYSSREAKLKQLYGPLYDEAISLDARLSLQYENYCDEHQPVLWPVLPIKLRD